MNSERGKHSSFLCKENLILCYNDSAIHLGLIPELCALSLQRQKVTFVLTSPLPHVVEKRTDHFKVIAALVVACTSIHRHGG